MNKLLTLLSAGILSIVAAGQVDAQDFVPQRRGHYDYHPGQYQQHRNHSHYVPGHYDYHRGSHYGPGANYPGYPGSGSYPNPGYSQPNQYPRSTPGNYSPGFGNVPQRPW